MRVISEFFRILGASLILQLPIALCLLAGVIYIVGTKIGIFKEDK